MRTNTLYRIQHDNGLTAAMLPIIYYTISGQCNILGVSLYMLIYRYTTLYYSVISKAPRYHIAMRQGHVIDKSNTGNYASKTYKSCIAYLRAIYNPITKYIDTQIEPIKYTTTRQFNMAMVA